MTKATKKKAAKLVLQHLKAKDAGKRGYKEADQALDELAKILPIGTAIAIDANGRTAKIVDQFAEKTTVFKPCGVRRYDIKVEEGAASA